MTKKEILKLSDSAIDKAVRIQGTNYDRRRKVTKQMQFRMMQMLNAGKSVNTIAEHFSVTPHTVKYNTDESYNSWYKKNRTNNRYYTVHSSGAERGAYKRNLLKSRKSVVFA